MSLPVRSSVFRTASVSRAARSRSRSRTAAPLCTMARWNSPRAEGIASSVQTFPPPPDSPKMVTLPESPPKRSMLSRTHSSAATMSSVPALPDAAKSDPPTDERSRKPKMLSRWFTVTTTTSPRLARREPCRRATFAVP